MTVSEGADGSQESAHNPEGVEENNNIFENPIFSSNINDDIDENSIRKTNLKKYNY